MTTFWERRDLPVLRALATSDDEDLRHGFLSITERQEAPLGLELEAGDVYAAVLALADAGYVSGELGSETGLSVHFTRLTVTGHGQQALGQWPLFDEIASPETLALLLERLAEEAPSDEEAENLRKAADYARSLGAASLRALAVGAVSQLARIAAGLG